MIAGLPLSFAQPLLLMGLLTLPVLWWLLRVMPPRPKRIEFPPTRLLFDIKPKEETPSRTPWWLTLLRLTAAALVILAAAGPIWNPQTLAGSSKAPLVILLDDGWSAAASWDTRIKAADELIANADNDRRGVALVALSEPARDVTLMPAGTARVALRQIAPTLRTVGGLRAGDEVVAAPPAQRMIIDPPPAPTAHEQDQAKQPRNRQRPQQQRHRAMSVTTVALHRHAHRCTACPGVALL